MIGFCQHANILQALQADKMMLDPLARRNTSYVTANDVCKYISELGISKVIRIEFETEVFPLSPHTSPQSISFKTTFCQCEILPNVPGSLI